MTDQTQRIRDVYREYRLGRVSFDQVISAADQTLARYTERTNAGPNRDATSSATQANPSQD